MTAQEEAASIFKSVISDLSSSACDVKSALRRCLHACQLLNWEAASWFEQELGGYAADAELPPHRLLQGRLVWEPKHIPGFSLNPANAVIPGYGELFSLKAEPTTVDFRVGIDWLISATAVGAADRTGEEKTIRVGPGVGITVDLERWQYVNAVTIAWAMNRIEHFAFEFASKQYRFLAYGEALTDIWQGYRQRVDESMNALNFGNHLASIQRGIQSQNPQDWRLAAYGCRNLIEDVARYLWRDSRRTYNLLPGSARNGKLEVTEDKYLNRISAYLHQQMVYRSSDGLLHDELLRLDASIRSLTSDASGAHGELSLDDVRQIAIATYFIVGSLVMKTDMEPIDKYHDA